MPNVLVIDDDRSVCEMVRQALQKSDLTTSTAMTVQDGLAMLAADAPDVVLLDIMLPGASGLDVFRQIQEIDRKLPVVFITSGTDSGTAIKAMQLGGFDYVTKPLDLPALTDLVEQAIDTRRMMSTPVALSTNEESTADSETFVGRSAPMVEVFKSIGRVAAQNVPVLIRGESGTGKELVARAIYQNSDRSEESFMAVNCAALPDALLESELFGHEKGAFTGADKQRIGKFEACNGGTIFLDEIGDMSPLVQSKMLRLLQQQEFERVGGNKTIKTDVRIIAATNLDLDKMVEEGEFREDLFYRLNGLSIHLPPLRERSEDIAHLLEHYLNLWARQMRRSDIEGISPEALELLQKHSWPGNVRELQSVVRQSLLNATGPVIVPSFLPAELTGAKPAVEKSADARNDAGVRSNIAPFIEKRLNSGTSDLYAEALEQMEMYLITRVLEFADGNQTKAAELLGITRGKVRNRVRQFGISLDKKVTLDEQDSPS
ncbi:sigma-54-dependent transcriptional regulator [Fuerstiella marisgermanici]|uniref:DNA-binding transcriptional regulator NtrC n=1 Tax=Fuerstiella marisgermanici TaxID=1891926 RepID=A0A1P8WJF7_9PLAN|nr:sigma-54 dependent transcriptional regulator [Fuerstiella marisgermanici]APZ94178.1 Nitrogen regulation protein NR(I) [Fuerstiella marisgermanici]